MLCYLLNIITVFIVHWNLIIMLVLGPIEESDYIRKVTMCILHMRNVKLYSTSTYLKVFKVNGPKSYDMLKIRVIKPFLIFPPGQRSLHFILPSFSVSAGHLEAATIRPKMKFTKVILNSLPETSYGTREYRKVHLFLSTISRDSL